MTDTALLEHIKRVIRCFPEYWEQDALLKNKLIDDIRSYKTTVIKALLANELIKDTYSLELDGITIFKVEDFVSMLRYKNYWEDSYTKYSNEIGLTNDGKYLNYTTDVVLDFPHKDGVLEGGMTKEDVGKREIYYHNVLAKKEIDTLLAPKVLSNMKKYNANGEQNIIKFNDTDNLIIKGNNLIALHTLKERYAGKVKLIYIDPPYNTGGDSFKYNDRFNRSTWLTFMKNRLKVAFSLLKEDGVIVIQTDNNENHYLKVLCDEIFGNNKFVTQVCVEMSATQGMKVAAAKNGGIVKNTEYLLFYSKDGRKNIIENLLYDPRSDYDMHYSKFLTYDYKVKNVKDVFME
ncbi:MAG: site-specific DNA-methyltransferase, partial [Atopostipes sp.]|nr:site-specific DNA-methyltransferase [Atopostipes sp.]